MNYQVGPIKFHKSGKLEQMFQVVFFYLVCVVQSTVLNYESDQ